MAKVHKNIHLTKRRGMNLYCQHVCLPIGQGTVPEVNQQNGKIALSHEIFLQKE